MIIYKYQIPNLAKPIPVEQRALGPSGELIDFIPQPVQAKDVLGNVVDGISPYVGTYGMGGPGFFGLQFDKQWLVIAIWGAAEWMTANGRNVGDSFHDNYDRRKPWLADWLPDEDADELSKNIVGTKIITIEVKKHSFKISFDNGFDLTIAEDYTNRPLLEGTKQPRVFGADDDLRKAVFLSNTTEIWV